MKFVLPYREAAPTQSPRRILHPPADLEVDKAERHRYPDKGEERHRYPPHSEVQIPYRPPAEHYGKLQNKIISKETRFGSKM